MYSIDPLCVDYLLYRSMFLNLSTNDEFLIIDAKSSQWLQEPGKIIKLFKREPVTKFLQDKFHLLVDNCNQFRTKRCYCVSVRHYYITTKIIIKKNSDNCVFSF